MDFWITLATIIATLLLGQLSKKFEIVKKKQIPLQNMLIGVLVFLTQYLITKNLNVAVAVSGIMSGGVYDLGKAILQIFKKEE